ncbi:hypothetical protein V1279_004863 [Bradyrhizobium sp. AZCC 1610]
MLVDTVFGEPDTKMQEANRSCLKRVIGEQIAARDGCVRAC